MIVPSTSLFIGDFQLPSLIAKGFFSAAGGCTWTLRSPTRINISSAQYRPIQQIDFFPKIGLYRLIINFTVGFSIMNHPSWVHFGTPPTYNIYIYIANISLAWRVSCFFCCLHLSKWGRDPKDLRRSKTGGSERYGRKIMLVVKCTYRSGLALTICFFKTVVFDVDAKKRLNMP